MQWRGSRGRGEGEQLIGHLVEQKYIQPLTAKRWLRDAMSPFDVVATLSAALAPAWTVEREIDPSGNITIIVFRPAMDRNVRRLYYTRITGAHR